MSLAPMRFLLLGVTAAALATAGCKKKSETEETATPSQDGGGEGDGGDAGSDGGTSDGGTTGGGKQPVKPMEAQYAPVGAGTLALDFPDSLTADGGGAQLRLMQAEGGAKSQGLVQLQGSVQTIEGQVAEATRVLLQCDQIATKMLAKCAGTYPCVAQAGEYQIPITPEYVAAVAAVKGEEVTEEAAALRLQGEPVPAGEEPFQADAPIEDTSDVAANTADKSLAEFNKAIGTTVPNDKCTIDKVDGTSTMTVAVGDSGYSFSVKWDEATKKHVQLHTEFGYSSAEFGGEGPQWSWKGVFDLDYHADTREMSTRGEYTSAYGDQVDTFTDSFKLAAVPEQAADHGVAGQFLQESNGFSITTTFAASDKGGRAETTFVSKMITVSNLTLTAAAEAGVGYVLAADDADVSNIYASAGGYVFGDGTPTPANVSYWGPTTVPSYTLFKEVWPAAPAPVMGLQEEPAPEPLPEKLDGPTYEKTTIKVQSATASVQTMKFFYVAIWDANGAPVSEGYKETEDGAWVYYYGEDVAQQPEYTEYADAGQSFEETAIVQVAVGGTNVAALSGAYLYIARGDVDLAALAPGDDAFNQAILGGAYYAGDWEAMPSDGMAGYEIWYNGTKDDVSTAKVYKEVWDPATGAVSYTLVSGATVSVVQ